MHLTFNAGLTIGCLVGSALTLLALMIVGMCQAAGAADEAMEQLVARERAHRDQAAELQVLP